MSNHTTWTKEQLDRHNEKFKVSARIKRPVSDHQSYVKVTRSDLPKPPARVKQHRSHTPGVMNGTEKRFEQEWIMPRMIAGEIADYWFESWTFKLAEKCRYTPDFVIQDREGYLSAYEIKGRTRNDKGKEVAYSMDDSKVKLKVSPRLFPLQFFLVFPRSKGMGWEIQEINH